MAMVDILIYKDEGNQHFKEENFEEAVKSYTKAVKLFPDLDDLDAADSARKQCAIVLANRSASYLGLKKWVAALVDAQRAEDADPSYWKGPWRQGIALMKMEIRIERSEQAITAFEKTLACPGLPDSQKQEVQMALGAAVSRLDTGRDNVPLPENCTIC